MSICYAGRQAQPARRALRGKAGRTSSPTSCCCTCGAWSRPCWTRCRGPSMPPLTPHSTRSSTACWARWCASVKHSDSDLTGPGRCGSIAVGNTSCRSWVMAIESTLIVAHIKLDAFSCSNVTDGNGR